MLVFFCGSLVWSQFFIHLSSSQCLWLEIMPQKNATSYIYFTIILIAHMRTCSMNRQNEKCFPNSNWLLTKLSDCCYWVYGHARVDFYTAFFLSQKLPQTKKIHNGLVLMQRILYRKLKKIRILLMNWINNSDWHGWKI